MITGHPQGPLLPIHCTFLTGFGAHLLGTDICLSDKMKGGWVGGCEDGQMWNGWMDK